MRDVGELGVGNAILDKPGKLEAAQWDAVRRHPAYTEAILARIPPFANLAVVAGAHHERLDGKGHPRGIDAKEIFRETRIITVADIFDAITAARPYRGAVPVPQAIEMTQESVGTALDREVFDALRGIVSSHQDVLAEADKGVAA